MTTRFKLAKCTVAGAMLVATHFAQADFCESPGSDPDGDGWGWENNQSCQMRQSAGTNCEDPDGDGWGWDGTGSCQVGGSTDGGTGGGITGGGGACLDPDGDGWGWDGSASCQIGGTTGGGTTGSGNTTGGNGAGDCVDPDGDGWGWNGVESCRVGVTPPIASGCGSAASGTTLVSSTGPVRSTGNSFYPDLGPQCVVPTNQFNGPGLKFGDFIMSNNAWNGDKSSWNWQQCISLTANGDGSVSPSWTYDWGNEDDLLPGYEEWEVKSYPEIIYGEKSRDEVSAPCQQTGLPVLLADAPDISIDYSYRATQSDNRAGDIGSTAITGGDRNIAVESFLHSSCDIRRGAQSNREFELMVWLERGPERTPSGKPPVGEYTDSAGRLYDVYTKPAGDDGYIAYVAKDKVLSSSLHWNDFFADAKANADTYQIKTVQDDWCLANILIGTEIWWGEGSFSLDYLRVNRTY